MLYYTLHCITVYYIIFLASVNKYTFFSVYQSEVITNLLCCLKCLHDNIYNLTILHYSVPFLLYPSNFIFPLDVANDH